MTSLMSTPQIKQYLFTVGTAQLCIPGRHIFVTTPLRIIIRKRKVPCGFFHSKLAPKIGFWLEMVKSTFGHFKLQIFMDQIIIFGDVLGRNASYFLDQIYSSYAIVMSG